jgi:hypothetical protein
MHDSAMTDVPSYVFTENVLAACEARREWAAWIDGDSYLTREHVHRYFSDLFGATAHTESEMALVVLGRNNMGGGVPIGILRMMARLSKIS